MVLRKARLPRRYDGATEATGDESESVNARGDSGALTRRMSAGKGTAMLDAGMANIPDEGRDLAGGRALKEVSRNRSGKLSDIPSLHLQETSISREETALNSPRATAEQTPSRSANGSVSGTSATQKIHRINTRSKGSAHTSSSASSSDHEDMPMESLSQLSLSLKLSQSRASVLSANYSRLMRMLLQDELDNLDREIAQVRNGTYQPLKVSWKALEANRDAKKRIANARLVAAEHEIDIRFSAQIDAQWQQFKNDKLQLRETMCTELSSRITRLTQENDRARSLAVGVRPDSSLQQAPWWFKNPKQYTWLNLPDGVNDDQRDKDLARMGIDPRSRHPNPSTIGLRTPSPEDALRKRKRQHYHDHDGRKRSRKEPYPLVDQRESEHLPPVPFEEEVAMSLWTSPWSALSRTQPRMGDAQPGLGDGSMSSLLHAVQDDIRYYMEPPPPPPPSNWLSLPDASTSFKHPPLQVGRRFTHHAPLLPRPSTMPQEQFIETFYPQSPRRVSLPPPPSGPPPLLPLPRLMPAQPLPVEQNGLSLLSTESAGRIPETTRPLEGISGCPPTQSSHITGSISPVDSRKHSIIAPREPNTDNISLRPNELARERDEYFAQIQPTEPLISPRTDSSHLSQSILPLIEHRQADTNPLPVPKAIAPRPISAPPPLPSPPVEPPKPTPIQPSPVIKSRSSSHSPDTQRNKRPLTLLPKGMPPPPSPPPPPSTTEPPAEDRTKYPLLRLGDKATSPSHVPTPPASMGRFGKMEPAPPRYTPYVPNPKIAIARHPSQVHENHVPLRIAPAPARKMEGSVNDEGVRGNGEIGRRSSGDQSSPREDFASQKNMEDQEGKKISRNSGRPKRG